MRAQLANDRHWHRGLDMLEAPSSQNLPGRSPFRRGHDVVMLLYLAAGALGLTFLVIMRFTTDGWIGLYLITALTSAIGWIPGVFLIVIYRNSWRVTIPAAILIVCGGIFVSIDLLDTSSFIIPSDSTVGLVTIFYVTTFLFGIEWLIQKVRRSRHK